MISTLRRAATALVAAVALTGCRDFLTSGEAGNDPNRPTTASASQLFVGVQTNIAALLGSDPQRIAAIFTQQLEGTGAAYATFGQGYSVSENTTNGFFTTVYGGGGLIDVRRVQEQARTTGDSTFVGIAQVQEALLIGTAADLFGNVIYTRAYGDPNPALDPQLAVYDSVQSVLTRAITNLAAAGPTNIGPGASDLVYRGNRARWTRLARTLKARFLLHTAEVRPTVYPQVLAEARLGIQSAADNYTVPFTGGAGERNFLADFNVNQRPGYIEPGETFVALLRSRNDPRLTRYFSADAGDLSAALNAQNAPLPLVTASENLLIQAEAAYRTGAVAEALTALNAEQTIQGVPVTAGLSGAALLREILTEKYIALFPSVEVWNDYKRTCFPNLTPKVAGRKIPARLLYDTSERQTNTSIPQPQDQPARNANDPANATDPFGNACLGQ